MTGFAWAQDFAEDREELKFSPHEWHGAHDSFLILPCTFLVSVFFPLEPISRARHQSLKRSEHLNHWGPLGARFSKPLVLVLSCNTPTKTPRKDTMEP